ncbi:hypothetical protein AB751O23_AF_00040 [Chlamydiales bacterium SCGC AB-751-O23]|jgi:hypothetical protein|nr:hypothetical protein AB751O23_AF_00040 [Chlamydiales bacterium SCGC AB-751-O23]
MKFEKLLKAAIPLVLSTGVAPKFLAQKAIQHNPELSKHALDFISKSTDRLWCLGKIGITGSFFAASALTCNDVDNLWDFSDQNSLQDKAEYICENAPRLFLANIPSIANFTLGVFCLYRFRDVFFQR